MQKWNPTGTVNTFRITVEGGAEPIIVRNSIADAIAYERLSKKPWHEAISAESMLWVAWRAAKREGLVTEPTFDQFAVTVLDLEVAEEVENEDPTQTGLSAD